MKKITNEEFILRAKRVHGEKYDYSKCEYKNAVELVCIICPEHGEFWQRPWNHIKHKGCPKCSSYRLGIETILKRFKEVHGNKYDYSKVEKCKSKDKITIICPKHGEFNQTVHKHLLGQGCPKCGKERMVEKQMVNIDEFIKRGKEVHNNKYDYSKVIYNNIHDKVIIICPIHGEFNQNGYDHLNGHGCPKCGFQMSKGEEEIYEFVGLLVGKEKVERRNRSVLNGKEIDIYIPSKKIGIEFNGILWHSEKYKNDNKYHLNKLEDCLKQDIKLFQIFEDEYNNCKEIVLSKIRYALGCIDDLEKVYGRKCNVKEINKEKAWEFLNMNHIQGGVNASVYLGCYDKNDILVAVMLFNKDNSEGKWVLSRYAGDITKHCIGTGGKMINYFKRKYEVKEIKSFADRRWTMSSKDNMYIRLGFELEKVEPPDYRYVNENSVERQHKFNFRKKILSKKYGFPLTMTESEMVNNLKYYKIWDCGLYKFVWKRAKSSE